MDPSCRAPAFGTLCPRGHRRLRPDLLREEPDGLTLALEVEPAAIEPARIERIEPAQLAARAASPWRWRSSRRPSRPSRRPSRPSRRPSSRRASSASSGHRDRAGGHRAGLHRAHRARPARRVPTSWWWCCSAEPVDSPRAAVPVALLAASLVFGLSLRAGQRSGRGLPSTAPDEASDQPPRPVHLAAVQVPAVPRRRQ